MPSVSEIRSHFLDFFARHDHVIVPSSSLVPHNDPTLLFTSAGMVQFKNVFTGVEQRPYKRAVTAQKCVRAGGKHNDLDNVGYTARHHTFFEMLGNFSFGDYFKERAIDLAWTLVTKEFGLPPERLLTTVHAEDDEAFELWRKIAGLPESKVLRIPTGDNFWAMGDTGPCGPCSEIFYDHGPEIAGGPPGSAEAEGDRFIEIWNLVFMQFEQLAPDKRVALPKPSVDTGMGLERVAAVLQGQHDNFEIDLFRRLIEASAAESGAAPHGPHRVSHRVVADHLRACAFLIADGVTPSNEGRGYVLRRIMRRAMRHAHLMGCEEPLMHRLLPTLIAEMGQAYPELARAQSLIAETLKLEETRFRATLARGLKLLDEETAKLAAGGVLPGEIAFKLYDTYGFPLDLTEDALRQQGLSVERAGFEQAMERQREQARASWAGSGEAATERVWFELREKCGATEFLGYRTDTAEGRVLALVKEGAPVLSVKTGDEVALIVNQTPFYGESGGQVGDTGEVVSASGARMTVSDTQKKLGDLHVHLGRLESGTLKVAEVVKLTIDAARRERLRANHSATHLLHAALRRRLGQLVTQKGSLVAPERLRFDISHGRGLRPEELAQVEAEVNRMIRVNAEVKTHLMAPEQAVEAGALALFGEKYGEEVRAVEMGEEGERFSIELCGGTHVRRTGDIGLFKIVSEGALAAGVRRIEALTGEAALAFVNRQLSSLHEAALSAKAPWEQLPSRIEALIEERKRLERELAEVRRRLAQGGGVESVTEEIAGIRFEAKKLEGIAPKELRRLLDDMKKRGSGVYALISEHEGKAALAVGVTDDLTARVNAVDLVRAGVAELGGSGGGGRPDMAQSGGPDASKAEAAFTAIKRAIRKAA